jgi:nucleotide-binding universal stress UspA family protein
MRLLRPVCSRITNRDRRSVLVGVDGSVSAQGALAWAAAEASFRQSPLRIVHAFTWPMISNPLDLTVDGYMSNGLQAAAEQVLAEAESHARTVAPDIKVTDELFVAGAAPTLLSQAQDAELVVTGSRGLGGFRGLLVGSVSAAVAAHAPCPVIVVHPHRDGTAYPARPTGRVVVGVDGSEVSTAAIRFALQEAARRHIGVTAVGAALPPRHQP